MRYLPIDTNFNQMAMNGLFAEQINPSANVYAVYRYRSAGSIQTFAAISFSSSTWAINSFQIYNSPDISGGGVASMTPPKSGGWFSTYVLSDPTVN